MKTNNRKKLPAMAFLFNFGFLAMFPIIYAYWMSADKSLTLAIADLLPVMVIGAAFFFVSLYVLRFTGHYFHRRASKGHTAMKRYTLLEVAFKN